MTKKSLTLTNIFPIFVSMNLFSVFLKFIFLTIVILPIWFSICLVGFFVAVILHIFFTPKLNSEIKFRNNIKGVYQDFTNNLLSIFFYY